jgi:hypothetical protein
MNPQALAVTLVNGFMFGIGLILAVALMKVLFHVGFV